MTGSGHFSGAAWRCLRPRRLSLTVALAVALAWSLGACATPPAPQPTPQPAPVVEAPPLPAQPPPAPEPERVTTPSGLIYQELAPGQGAAPTPGQEVVIHFTARLEGSQALLEDTRQQGGPARFVLGARRVLPAWEEGVASMLPGGRRRLIVPPSLAYGARGVPGAIPPDATIIYELELVEVR